MGLSPGHLLPQQTCSSLAPLFLLRLLGLGVILEMLLPILIVFGKNFPKSEAGAQESRAKR